MIAVNCKHCARLVAIDGKQVPCGYCDAGRVLLDDGPDWKEAYYAEVYQPGFEAPAWN